MLSLQCALRSNTLRTTFFFLNFNEDFTVQFVSHYLLYRNGTLVVLISSHYYEAQLKVHPMIPVAIPKKETISINRK